MRTFEMLLILANVLSLLLGFKKQSKVVWFIISGINLSVLLLHGILEGIRYQMAFSYLFVILIIIYTLAKMNKRFYARELSKTMKVIGISLSLILLMCTSILAYALPVFTLPKPMGKYAVGVKYFNFTDSKRNEPFLKSSKQKRELMVKVYYPAKKDDAKPFAPYFNNSLELIRLFVTQHNMPEFMFDHLKQVKTNTKEGLLLADQQSSYPIVLFSHGAGDTMEVQASQSENLASHGYVVVAIDHTYASAGTSFPDRMVSQKEATTQFNNTDPAEVITQIMADDSKFVIEKMSEINEGKLDSLFKGKLNLNGIGAIGHSVGGAVAYNLAINDRRVKAAIDLDGTVFVTPKKGAKMAPFLMLANDKKHIQALQKREILLQNPKDVTAEEKKDLIFTYGSEKAYLEAYNKSQQNMNGLTNVLKASGNLYTIAGSDHMKFNDIGLFIGNRQMREFIGIKGMTDPTKCLEIAGALAVSFFDQHLKDEKKSSMESLITQYPELRKVDLK